MKIIKSATPLGGVFQIEIKDFNLKIVLQYKHPETFVSGCFSLVKENHQLCWWLQKAFAMPRINYPSEAGNSMK